MIVLPNGTILATGGKDFADAPNASSELYIACIN
jgi:hypothetical protein